MKKFSKSMLSGLIGLLLGLSISFTAIAFADNGISNNIKLIINGKEIQCDVPPQLINGRVLIPARAILEAIGAQVTWDSTNQEIIVNTPTQSVTSTEPTTSVDPNQLNQPVDNTPINPTINNVNSDSTTNITSPTVGESVFQSVYGNVIKTTYKGMNAIVVQGITYFRLEEYVKKYAPNSQYWDYTTNSYIINGVSVPAISIENYIIYGGIYINSKYF